MLDDAVCLGPLEPLLMDASIREIMVNRYDENYVEREGRLWRHSAVFGSQRSVRWVIKRIVVPLGRHIDESSPMIDARLPDGFCVNAIILHVAMKGTSLTIRTFPFKRRQMLDLILSGSLDEAVARFFNYLCASRSAKRSSSREERAQARRPY